MIILVDSGQCYRLYSSTDITSNISPIATDSPVKRGANGTITQIGTSRIQCCFCVAYGSL